MERIDRIIASQTMLSRSQIKEMIKRSQIKLNGVICKSPEIKADPFKDIIEIGQRRIEYRKNVYYMMNKPKGVLSASTDKRAQTVIDLIDDRYRRKNLFPAGRLDKDTTGLLIITDDGDFAHRMLSPTKKVYKQYIATLDRAVDSDTIEKFRNGVTLHDGTKCREAFVQEFKDEQNKDEQHKALVKICEGKFHQVKKMFAACSYTVLELCRIRIGSLSLDNNLAPSQMRELTDDEKSLIFDDKFSIY